MLRLHFLCAAATAATTIASRFVTYCINQIVNAVMEKFGIDTRSDGEKILDKLYNKRFAGGLNVKTSDHSPINGWGKAENRFGGLMVLGIQNSKLYS